MARAAMMVAAATAYAGVISECIGLMPFRAFHRLPRWGRWTWAVIATVQLRDLIPAVLFAGLGTAGVAATLVAHQRPISSRWLGRQRADTALSAAREAAAATIVIRPDGRLCIPTAE